MKMIATRRQKLYSKIATFTILMLISPLVFVATSQAGADNISAQLQEIARTPTVFARTENDQKHRSRASISKHSDRKIPSRIQGRSGDVRGALQDIMNSVNSAPAIVNSLLSYSDPDPKRSFSIPYGIANPEEGAVMTEYQQIHIGSMSKLLTAVVVLQMVEEGHFGIDSTLGDLFGEQTIGEIFPGHQFTRINTAGTPVSQLTINDLQRYRGEPLGGEITVSDLLRHTHGMPDLLFDAPEGGGESLEVNVILDSIGLPNDEPGISEINWTGESLLEYYLAGELPQQSLFFPDGGFHYGGTGYIIAGLLIEKFGGVSLQQAYEDRIFVPLSMGDSYMHGFQEPRITNSTGLAHRFYDLSDLVEGFGNIDVDADGWNTTVEWASSGLVSTAADLHGFYRSLVTGQLFQNPETLEELTFLVEIGGSAGNGIGNAYGAGVGVVLDWVTQTPLAFEHSGYWGSYFIYVPESDVSVVLTVNQVASGSRELIEGIRNLVIGDIRGCLVGNPDYERKISRLKKRLRRANRIIRKMERRRDQRASSLSHAVR